MKKKKINSIDEATRSLGVKDVSELKPEHATKFIELLPQMDKDIALNLLNLCPNLIQITPEVLLTFERMSESALHHGGQMNDAVVFAYQSVIDECRKALEDDQLSLVEKERLLNLMVEVADKMAAKDTEHKKWVKDVHENAAKYGLAALGTVLGIVAVVAFGPGKGKK